MRTFFCALLRGGALLAVACLAAPTLVRGAADPAALLRDPVVQAALAAVKRHEPETLDLQVRLCEIPAPPFKEEVRGLEVKRLFESLGLQDVRVDRVGNVIGVRRGERPTPNIVLSAHLDTVFPEGTPVTVKRDGPLLMAPGIGDDARGLAVMLSVIRALNETKVPTQGTLTFVATVGEEGLGDLRGVKALFAETLKDQIDAFVSIDTTGISTIVAFGVGSYRYRVTFRGPGGHSYSAFGLVNPAHALGRAIAKIASIEVPAAPKVTYNVGRIGGGTSVNSIPNEAWMEVDLRSPDAAALETLRGQITSAINDGAKEENARRGKGETTVTMELAGYRPAGSTPAESTLVRTAQAVVASFGERAVLVAMSTDANVPMQLGIPAITIGGGGQGRNAHALDETFDSTDSWKGSQAALLLAVALAN